MPATGKRCRLEKSDSAGARASVVDFANPTSQQEAERDARFTGHTKKTLLEIIRKATALDAAKKISMSNTRAEMDNFVKDNWSSYEQLLQPLPCKRRKKRLAAPSPAMLTGFIAEAKRHEAQFYIGGDRYDVAEFLASDQAQIAAELVEPLDENAGDQEDAAETATVDTPKDDESHFDAPAPPFSSDPHEIVAGVDLPVDPQANADDANTDANADDQADDNAEMEPETNLLFMSRAPSPSSTLLDFHRFFLQEIGFDGKLLEHIMSRTHQRQRERESHIMQKLRDIDDDPSSHSNDRGRKRNSPGNITYYREVGPLGLIDVLNYIAINIHGGLCKLSSIEAYFRSPAEMEASSLKSDWFAPTRMTLRRFSYISQVIDFDIDWLCGHLETKLQSAYCHLPALAGDETMAPLQIRNMCHHMFIHGKPHPNGILGTTLADANLMMLAYRIRRRTADDHDISPHRPTKQIPFKRGGVTSADPSTTTDLILQLRNRIDKSHPKPTTERTFVVVDSLYGSLELAAALSATPKAIGMIGKCRLDRPRWIFQTNCMKIASKHSKLAIGQWASMEGKFPDNKRKFAAFSIIVGLRAGKPTYAHLLSTEHGPLEHGFSAAITESIQEKDGTVFIQHSLRPDCPGVLSAYNKASSYVDRVNARVVCALPIYRWTRWKAKYLLFLLMVLYSNAHRLGQLYYQKITSAGTLGSKEDIQIQYPAVHALQLPWAQYRDVLKNELVRYPPFDHSSVQSHEIQSLVKSGRISSQGNPVVRARCSFCKARRAKLKLRKAPAQVTSNLCKSCSAPICFHCQRSPGIHTSCATITNVQIHAHRREFDGDPTCIIQLPE